MDILNSAWFLRMVDKASATPRGRLLAAFDILADWIDAPHMRQQLELAGVEVAQQQALIEYLTTQARAAGIAEPELLAQQLYFMAHNMLQEELRTPSSAASRHARQVAQALIQAQTEKDRLISKRSAYAIAASLCLCTAIGSSLLTLDLNKPASAAGVHVANTSHAVTPAPLAANPRQTAAMFASLEQMRSGTCQYPEALMLPESQKSIYIESVVGGLVPTIAQDQQIFVELLQKVRCNYTPMLMANSAG